MAQQAWLLAPLDADLDHESIHWNSLLLCAQRPEPAGFEFAQNCFLHISPEFDSFQPQTVTRSFGQVRSLLQATGCTFLLPSIIPLCKDCRGFPFTLLETTIWTLIVYFMAGLSLEDGGWHFWVYYLIVTLTALNGASLVHFMSYFALDRDAANATIGFLCMVVQEFLLCLQGFWCHAS